MLYELQKSVTLIFLLNSSHFNNLSLPELQPSKWLFNFHNKSRYFSDSGIFNKHYLELLTKKLFSF